MYLTFLALSPLSLCSPPGVFAPPSRCVFFLCLRSLCMYAYGSRTSSAHVLLLHTTFLPCPSCPLISLSPIPHRVPDPPRDSPRVSPPPRSLCAYAYCLYLVSVYSCWSRVLLARLPCVRSTFRPCFSWLLHSLFRFPRRVPGFSRGAHLVVSWGFCSMYMYAYGLYISLAHTLISRILHLPSSPCSLLSLFQFPHCVPCMKDHIVVPVPASYAALLYQP